MLTPTNPKRNEDYKGKNAEILARAGYSDPRWATFREWISLGRVVHKGQKGTKIARIRGKDAKTGAARFGRGSVFNFEQTVVLTPKAEKAPKSAPVVENAPIAECPF